MVVKTSHMFESPVITNSVPNRMNISHSAGIYQVNYSHENFVRKSENKDIPVTIPLCLNDIDNNSLTKIKGIGSYYSFEKTFLADSFKKYNRTLTGGASGSVYFLYYLVFKILKYEHTLNNIILVLFTAIMDYVPLWHSIEEILLTLSIEIIEFIKIDSNSNNTHMQLDKYTIDVDPIEYLKKILNVIKSPSDTKGGKQIKRYTKKRHPLTTVRRE